MLENLADPVTVYLFFQMGMDVTDEIRTYFDEIQTDKVDIRYVDKDIEPTLAKELGVQNNGMIVLTIELKETTVVLNVSTSEKHFLQQNASSNR